MRIAFLARDDNFAGTPPLKFVRLAVALCAKLMFDGVHCYLFGIWDVSNAFFYAKIPDDEPIHVVPPRGEEEPGVV